MFEMIMELENTVGVAKMQMQLKDMKLAGDLVLSIHAQMMFCDLTSSRFVVLRVNGEDIPGASMAEQFEHLERRYVEDWESARKAWGLDDGTGDPERFASENMPPAGGSA